MTNRQPKGTPVGGQFAEGRKPEGYDLSVVVPLSTLPRGERSTLDALARSEELDATDYVTHLTNGEFFTVSDERGEVNLSTATPRDFANESMTLIRDNVKVELEDIGEGLSGDYDEDDPDDISLLRFSVYIKTDDPDYEWSGGWKAVDDASYCTNLPTDLSPEQTQVALNALMNEFHNVLNDDPEASVKGLGEEMSWIGPGDLAPMSKPVLTPEQDEVATAYKVAALWASNGDDGEPLDAEFSVDQISDESNEAIARDVVKFWEEAKAEGLTEHWTPDQFGHDFFLTREGHGAGFWDRGFGDVGKRLTEMAKAYPAKTPIVGDDGHIYFE